MQKVLYNESRRRTPANLLVSYELFSFLKKEEKTELNDIVQRWAHTTTLATIWHEVLMDAKLTLNSVPPNFILTPRDEHFCICACLRSLNTLSRCRLLQRQSNVASPALYITEFLCLLNLNILQALQDNKIYMSHEIEMLPRMTCQTFLKWCFKGTFSRDCSLE